MKNIANTLLISFLFISASLSAQLVEQTPVKVRRINTPILIDGNLEEAAWSEDQANAEDFWLYFPTDSMRATMDTEIRMTFDDKNLYVGVKCYSVGKDYMIQ